ncbi:hypothetical protein MRQ36_19580 [Micromonospora sp. R77]|uniref:hypothetical protein n=1 Tax=Micromonospora sp. R77 TaxID=2925836 RepID=UPI001F612CFB|nr:hypothetical protein [Micromonospora sp. R77]MCI4064654.1 hypothetical protein [Micromonospora sp. R77]
MRSERRRVAALLALSALVPVTEAAVIAAIGFQAVRGLSPQSSAVWPYGAYHDMRWLLVYHRSIPGFLLELLAITVLRGVYSAALVGFSWPAQQPRPSWRWLVRRNVEVAALAAVVVSPWAAFSVAFATVTLSWFLAASLVPMLILSPFLIRAGAVDHWWRGLPSAELVGWSALNVVLLTAAGAVAASVPGWWPVPVVAVAGVANGLLRRRTVHGALLPRRVRWARVPVAPLAVVLTVVLVVLVQGVVGVAGRGTRGEWRPPVVTRPLPPQVRHAVIALAGHDSSFDGQPPVDPRVERFSYRGLDARGRPMPYLPRDTHRSLQSSAALLAAQVDEVHRRTGRPVALLGQSEGAMVVRTFLEHFPGSPVEAALLFSPLVRPGRSYYPPPQARSGWGVVSGWELRAIVWLANLVRTQDQYADEPFIRSIVDNAPFYRNRALCPVPGVRMVAFLPTTSAAEAPPGQYAGIPVVQIPGFHGSLLGRPEVQDQIADFLTGANLHAVRPEYRLIQLVAAPWQLPPLKISLNPVWGDDVQNDPAFSGRVCPPR